MYSKGGILLISVLASANAGILEFPAVRVLQGPGSKTTLLGPDGSAVDSKAPGGTVLVDQVSGLVPVGPAFLGASPDILVKGPAGSVLTSYTAAGPAIVQAIPAGADAVAAATGIASVPGALASSALGFNGGDHAGDYIPDNSEKLYDDGSYRGE